MSTKTVPARVVALTYYEETGILFSQFTDGGAAAGTYQVKFTLPVGFYVERSQVYDVTGFAGDTSAVIVVGDGSDVDRYNTGTPSVFATISQFSLGMTSSQLFISTL